MTDKYKTPEQVQQELDALRRQQRHIKDRIQETEVELLDAQFHDCHDAAASFIESRYGQNREGDIATC